MPAAGLGEAACGDDSEDDRLVELQASFVSEVDELRRLLQKPHFEADERAEHRIAAIVRHTAAATRRTRPARSLNSHPAPLCCPSAVFRAPLCLCQLDRYQEQCELLDAHLPELLTSLFDAALPHLPPHPPVPHSLPAASTSACRHSSRVPSSDVRGVQLQQGSRAQGDRVSLPHTT